MEKEKEKGKEEELKAWKERERTSRKIKSKKISRIEE